MLSKQLAYGLALVAGLALTSTASAGDDVIRLDLRSSSGAVLTLGGTQADLDADTLDTRFYGGRGGRGGFYGGFNRGFYGGGFNRGFYGGGFNRGFYVNRGFSGFNRGFYGFNRGFYRPFVYSYYSPYYFNYYSYYQPFCGYYGISAVNGADTYAICSRSVQQSGYYYFPAQQPNYQPQPQQNSQPQAPRVMPRADDTFPYDGGPKSPVPMPRDWQESEDARPAVVPYKRQQDETLVSLEPKQAEKKASKWNYPAYGEKPTRGK